MMKRTWLRLGGGLGLTLLVVFGVLFGSRWGALALPSRMANQATNQRGISCASWRTGSGMMGNGSSGGMMGGSSGLSALGAMWGLMGNVGMMGTYDATAQPISATQARWEMDRYATSCGNGIKVGDFMTFASNDYGVLVDAAGHGYLEVIVDRFTGAISPEPQAIMWNTTSGMHASQGAARYDQAAAQQLATTFLASYLPGAKVLMGTAFPGYDTFDFGPDQAHAVGMLSVDAATGQIWVHTWHGPGLGGA